MLWSLFGESLFHTGKTTEVLIAIHECCKIAVILPDHRLALYLFELQGKLNLYFKNYNGSIKAFERMRDVAEDS